MDDSKEGTPIDVADVLKGTVAEIVPQLAGMSEADLAALLEGEQTDSSPRKTLIEAIALAQLERADQAALAEPANDAEAPASPAWQEPDYCGPLNGEQAAWRNAHLKRLDG